MARNLQPQAVSLQLQARCSLFGVHNVPPLGIRRGLVGDPVSDHFSGPFLVPIWGPFRVQFWSQKWVPKSAPTRVRRSPQRTSVGFPTGSGRISRRGVVGFRNMPLSDSRHGLVGFSTRLRRTPVGISDRPPTCRPTYPRRTLVRVVGLHPRPW